MTALQASVWVATNPGLAVAVFVGTLFVLGYAWVRLIQED